MVEKASGGTRDTQSVLSQQDVWYEGARKSHGRVSKMSTEFLFKFCRSRHDRFSEVDTALKRPKSSWKSSILPSRDVSYYFVTLSFQATSTTVTEEDSLQFVAIDLWTTKTRRWNIHICNLSGFLLPCIVLHGRTEIIMRHSDKARLVRGKSNKKNVRSNCYIEHDMYRSCRSWLGWFSRLAH